MRANPTLGREPAPKQDKPESPLTDSNRRPLPYHVEAATSVSLGAEVGLFAFALAVARAIAIPSRKRIRGTSTSKSAKVARMLKNIWRLGSVGSQAALAIENRTPG